MQNKSNDVRAVSDEQASTMVVLDEASLEDASGGISPAVFWFAAGYLFKAAMDNRKL